MSYIILFSLSWLCRSVVSFLIFENGCLFLRNPKYNVIIFTLRWHGVFMNINWKVKYHCDNIFQMWIICELIFEFALESRWPIQCLHSAIHAQDHCKHSKKKIEIIMTIDAKVSFGSLFKIKLNRDAKARQVMQEKYSLS